MVENRIDLTLLYLPLPHAGMNIFVAFFVLLLLLADSTPPAASSIPLIGRPKPGLPVSVVMHLNDVLH